MPLTAAQRSDINSIFLASTVSEASEEQLAQLNALLQESIEARRYLAHLAQLHTSLSWGRVAQEIATPDDKTPDDKPLAASPVVPSPEVVVALTPATETQESVKGAKTFWNLSPPERLSPTAVLTIACSMLLALGVYLSQTTYAPLQTSRIKAVVVAELQSDECIWAEEQADLQSGDPIRSSQILKLVQGVAKLQFKDDVTVIVEGPAVFEPITPMSMRLASGSVVVRCNGVRNDFTVISPEASIVDLGTSFGVHAGEGNQTEVEVFEGAVEVHPGSGSDSEEGHILGLGGAALIRRSEQGTSMEITSVQNDRFGKLLEALWGDTRQETFDLVGGGNGSVVQAEFNDAPIPHTVDTFYGSTRGQGWKTPWLASGNPKGIIRQSQCLTGEDSPYLSLTFGNSIARVIAREYGPRSEFDPRKPHVISWRWRFDKGANKFGGHYRDRILFCGFPRFTKSTGPTSSWLICVIGAGQEENGEKEEHELRQFYPMRWAFYDRQGDGGNRSLDGFDMQDTGMTFKPGLVYSFAVAVYPQEGRYDAAIRGGEQTVVRTGLHFRSLDTAQANVIHFNVRTAKKKKGIGYSLDSLRIEPLEDGGLRRRLAR